MNIIVEYMHYQYLPCRIYSKFYSIKSLNPLTIMTISPHNITYSEKNLYTINKKSNIYHYTFTSVLHIKNVYICVFSMCLIV